MIFRLHSTLPGGVLDCHGDEEEEDYEEDDNKEEEEREKRKRSNHLLPVP